MKKYINILLLAVMGIFVMSSCAREEKITFHPEDTAPSTLQNIDAAYVLEDGGSFATFNFSAADYGLDVAVQYVLYADLAGNGFTSQKKLGTAKTGEYSITVAGNDMNSNLISWGCEPNTPVDVEFRVQSDMYGESTVIANTTVYTNVIKTTITPFKAEKTYKSIYFRGGFNGWEANDAHRLFCYAEDDNTYTGTVDFDANGLIADHVAQGFKFADSAWGDINLGTSDTEVEASKITLVAGGDNIFCYTEHRYYSFEVKVEDLTATKLYGFDKMGIIGLNGDWDNDIDMTWNAYYGRFYADVEVAASTSYKFRLDAGWDNNWGVDGAKGGDNIPIESGNYRIYFYFSNAGTPTYEMNADMYGKEEPTEPITPDPPAEPVWAVIGEVGGTSWDTDFAMTNEGDEWAAILSIEGGFKIRYNASWADEDVRGAETEGFIAEDDVEFPAVSPGQNIAVAEAGTYLVVYNTADETICVTNMGNQWSLIGEIDGSSWDTDFFMTEGEDGKWVSDPVNITGGFKLRFNMSWEDADCRGAKVADFVFEKGAAFEVEGPGQNIAAPEAADYIVTYDPATETVVVDAALPQNLWSLIGGVEGSSWDKDFYMTQDPTGAWISDPVTINGEFKIRYNNGWTVNRGGTMSELGMPFDVVQEGANIALTTYDVKYQIFYFPDFEQIRVVPCTDAWSLIGEYNGTSWNYDVLLYSPADGIWISDIFYVEAAAGFKIRQNCAWDADRGGTFAAIGEPFEAVAGGGNIAIPTAGYYALIYNENDATITIRYAWSVIGEVNGSSWDKDFWLRSGGRDVLVSAPFIANGGFKIRAAGGWDADRGGVLGTLDTPFTAVPGGDNIVPLTAGDTYTLSYDKAAETITISAPDID